MTAWIKTVDGKAIKLKDSKWRAKIYAFGEACDDPEYLESRVRAYDLIHSIKYTYKRVDILQKRKKKSRVLEIQVKDPHRIKKLAEALEQAFQNPTSLKQYNVDVLPEQQYFYEKDLFPLAYVEVDVREDREIRKWNVLDSVTSYTYEIPKLQTLRIAIEISDLVPKMDSKLLSISLYSPDDNAEEKEIAKIKSTSEENILLETIKEIKRIDPDLIITSNGDFFVLPFLYSKASKYSVDISSKLNRDNLVSNNQKGGGGRTYFSYGRILYRPNTQRLYGRLHLDEQNTLVYDQCMLEGLYEVSRLCRIPIHTSMRASIGKCLSSLQFYYAFKEDILIPWKPDSVEDFKNGWELFVADRGGLVLKPLPGVHEHVGELDFASLYPSIIRKYNISAETVNCACCSNGKSKYQIEELHMHICDKREGIVSRSLALPLSKRFEYKRLRDQTKDKRLKKIYNERAGSLKWILVCCLAKESPVLVKRNGVISYVKIGSFIDSIVGERQGIIDCPDDMFVAGVDQNLKSKFSKIKKLLKVPNKQRLLNITMDDGRKIIATPNHQFYLLKNGELEVKQASELKVGEFIPVAKRLPSSIQSEKFIDVIDRLTKTLGSSELGRWRVSGSILSQILLDNKQIVLEESMKQGYSNQAIRAWIKMGMVPLRFFDLLNVPFELRKSLRVGIGRIKGKFGRTSWIPAVIPINEELGFFLGLYASDGSTTKTYIRLDIGYFETDLLENTCRITKSLFQTTPHIYKEKNVNMFLVQINNLALVKFIEQILDIPNTSEKGKLKVPQLVFNSDKMVAQGFLEGILAGDGSMNKTRTFASIATASRDFAIQKEH